MTVQIDTITLGVQDLKRSRDFYESALGYTVARAHADSVVLRAGPGSSPLELRPWAALAQEAAESPDTSGFRGFTLSFILAAADEVDAVLERAAQHGGRISKAPRNAVWGYSAYITDPDGYLWKVASTKRRPLIARKGAAEVSRVRAKEVPVTIGVADIKRAKAFYKDVIGLPIKKDYRKFVMFEGGSQASALGMYAREALADDAAVSATGSGFQGLTITHRVGSSAEVDALLDRVAGAGATVVRRPTRDNGTYAGSFADLDGFIWRAVVAS